MRLLDGAGGIGLLDDARLLPDGVLSEAVSAHDALRKGPYGALIGGLVVPDRRLGELDRLASARSDRLTVVVVNTSGAGGLLSLAGRTLPALRVLRVQSALRDPDDLAVNAARVVAAAAALGDVEVAVEIPDGFGFDDAVDEVESGGLIGQLVIEGSSWRPRLEALVEADLPFCLRSRSGRWDGEEATLTEVLDAVADIVDGCQAAEIEPTRMRRRIRAISCAEPEVAAARLVEAGLLSPPDAV